MKTKTFQTQFGQFAEGQYVRYSVYPLGNNILGRAYPDKIQAIDPSFVAMCERQGVVTHCEWEAAHEVRPADTERKYCAYCKTQTPHVVVISQTDGHGTGRDLRCAECGSSRMGEIQGFDASLM